MKNEIRVISSVVNEKNLAPALAMSNVDELFYDYADVWEFIKEYYYRNREVAPKDLLEEQFDIELPDTSGTVKHYLEQLRDEYQTMMLDRISRGLAKDLEAKPNSVLIDKLQEMMIKVVGVTADVKDLDITDTKIAIDHFIETKKRMEENGGVLGIRSGYDAIDASYPTGLAGGHYVVVLSRTGQGKSWFVLSIANNVILQGMNVLYISLEMPPDDVRNRSYSLLSEGKFTMNELTRASFDIDDMKKWTDEKFNKLGKLWVVGTDGMGDFSTPMIQSKIDQYAPDLVVVDYLQLLQDKRNSSGETEKIRNVSKEAKSLSLTNNIPIIMVAAASSHETKEYNNPPQIYECAGSKQAVFDVDLLLSLISKKVNSSAFDMEVVSRKNRHGPDFDFKIDMDISKGIFREVFLDDEIDMFEEL